MSTTENAHYREVAEYATTVEAARKAAGIVAPADCLAYELRQYEAACATQIHGPADANGPAERLTPTHPDYARQLAEHREEAERQLGRVYELRRQELRDELTAACNNALDERLLMACLLKETAHRLLDGYTDYLTLVGTGQLLPISVVRFRITGTTPVETPAGWANRMKERSTNARATYGATYTDGRYGGLDRALIAAGAGAAELAHFKRLLTEFHEAEQATGRETKTAKLVSAITQEAVNDLLKDAGVGNQYNKPGEWAAALRALNVAGILKGTAPEVTRWAVEREYVKYQALETVKKVWGGDFTDAEQFSNANQKTVFRNVYNSAVRLLTVNGLIDNNK